MQYLLLGVGAARSASRHDRTFRGSPGNMWRALIWAVACSGAIAGCGPGIPTASPASHSLGAGTTPSPAAAVSQWSDFSGGSWAEQGGHIFTSQNSGGQWTDVTPNVCAACSVNADAFLSAQDAVHVAVGSASEAASAAGGADRVWVAGYRTGGTPESGGTEAWVAATKDAGHTWTTTTLAVGGVGAGIPVETASLDFAGDGLHGLLALEITHSAGAEGESLLWSTADGGGSWTQLPNRGPAGEFTVLDPDDAWAVPELSGVLERTTDGGASWSTFTLPANPYVLGPVEFADASHGLLLAADLTPSETTADFVVYSTADGGQTWVRGTTVSPPSASAFGYGTGPRWVTMGADDAAMILGRQVVETTDAGASWQVAATLSVDGAGLLSWSSQGQMVAAYYSQTCTSKSASSCTTVSGVLASSDSGHTWKSRPAPTA